jgi:hypothetical protein
MREDGFVPVGARAKVVVLIREYVDLRAERKSGGGQENAGGALHGASPHATSLVLTGTLWRSVQPTKMTSPQNASNLK